MSVDAGPSVEIKVNFERGRRGRRRLGAPQADLGDRISHGRLPRVTKLMALAVRFDDLIRRGIVRDQADLARLGHVTRARVTQILNMTLLAPDIQAELLELPRVRAGRDAISERRIRLIVAVADWREQRGLWRRLTLRANECGHAR